MANHKLLAVVGPTATGKSAIAMKLARELDGEIVSCDSVQVYRYMDIGAAKATPEEQMMTPHHMLNIVEPDYDYTVAEYQQQAQGCIADIQSRGKLPILTGGSGLYYQAVVDNYDFMPLDGQPEVRRRLEQRVEYEGLPALYARLKEVDPTYAGIVGGNDRKRIIRALEVYEITGQPFSQAQRKQSPDYDLVCIGLTMERSLLYERIETRVDRMLSDGLLDEVEALRRRGYGLGHKALNSLGYRQALQYLEGQIDYDEMVNRIKKESRRFAKRQFTWFKRDDRIQWVEAGADDDVDAIYKKITDILAKKDYFM